MKPVILTVYDDLQVLRAIDMDLRQKYAVFIYIFYQATMKTEGSSTYIS
jgi:hypothetical protein